MYLRNELMKWADFFHADTNLGKLRVTLVIIGWVKNEWGLIEHGTLKLGVSHKWFDELSILTEWFLHADINGIILFSMNTPIYSVSLTSKWRATTAVVFSHNF